VFFFTPLALIDNSLLRVFCLLKKLTFLDECKILLSVQILVP